MYLDSWLFVQHGIKRTNDLSGETSEPVKSFVENWTNKEFQGFVGDLAALVDSLDLRPGTFGWNNAEEVWGRVVELEQGFWPDEEEQKTVSV